MGPSTTHCGLSQQSYSAPNNSAQAEEAQPKEAQPMWYSAVLWFSLPKIVYKFTYFCVGFSLPL